MGACTVRARAITDGPVSWPEERAMGEIAAEAVDTCRFVQQAGHGTVHRCVPLRGDLTLPDGRTAPPWLCQTRHGVWVAAAAGDQGKAIDVLAAHPAGYEERLLGDRLTVGLLRFTVPYGKASAARRALAMGRLLRDAVFPVFTDLPRPAGPWIEDFTELEQVWLAAQISPTDPVLAWLHTTTPAQVEGALLQGSSAQWRLLLTRDRACLVSVSSVGDVAVLDLPAAPLEVVEQTGRNAVVAGDLTWTTTLSNGTRYIWVAPLPAVEGVRRVREAARIIARPGTAEGRRLAARLLAGVDPEGDPLDALYRATLHFDEGAAGAVSPETAALAREAVAALKAEPDGGERLADWMVGWEPPLELARTVLNDALAGSDSPEDASWSLPFHQALRNRLVADSDDRFERTEADIALAEHFIYAGDHAGAARLLEPRLAALPDEDLASVLPPEGADLTLGQGGQPAHIRVLELLVLARGEVDRADSTTLATLARHQPLVRERLDSLVESLDSGNLRHRALRARAVLEPGGLSTPPVFDAPPSRGLPAEMVEQLPHPVARSGGALARVQAALAKVTPPDVGVLRRYCERLTQRVSPDAVAAVADACVMLGMPAVPAYLAAGDHRTGLRSHESPEPFLLIGSDHLTPESDLFLSPAELRFAIGAEVAHLRFQHSRITSDEVWAGVWDKGAVALTTTASLLPFLRYLPVDLIGHDRTYRAVRTVVPERWLRTIYGVSDATRLATSVTKDLGKLGDAAAGTLDVATGAANRITALTTTEGTRETVDTDISPDDRRLIAAHRVMQITADRAGLVLCGDLGAAVRAMFLLQSRLRPELTVAERVGLSDALGRRDPSGAPLLPGLSVRIAALAAFWLSDDYARLRDAIGATDHLAVRSAPQPAQPLEPEEVPAGPAPVSLRSVEE